MRRSASVDAAPAEHELNGPLTGEEAETLAEAMRAFGTASRLRLLWAMRGEERSGVIPETTTVTGNAAGATGAGRAIPDLLEPMFGRQG